MFDIKKLTDDQIKTIKSWALEGAQLSDVQKRMEEELELVLTYMDTRFMVLDLGIEIRNLNEETKSEDSEEADRDELSKDSENNLSEEDLEILPPTPQGKGPVSVSVDEIARPGVMASGRVTFSDSQSGMWYVDEMGRVGIDPDTAGYRPTEADVRAFQSELQKVMETR